MDAYPMKDLLICLAHHSAPGRLAYLQQVLRGFQDWQMEMDVVIDTNVASLEIPGFDWDDISVMTHVSLEHPFHLTWQHRKHFKERIDQYGYFLYVENDILIPYANFLNYQRFFELLWPQWVPAFVRIEEQNGQKYLLDVIEKQRLGNMRQGVGSIPVGDRRFCALSQPYHACWAMPATALRETMRDDFVRLSDSRETAASYPSWELGKTPLVQLDGDQISPLCYAFHVSNNYVRCEDSPHSKIRVEDIFK